jgi:hypothetical protein
MCYESRDIEQTPKTYKNVARRQVLRSILQASAIGSAKAEKLEFYNDEETYIEKP